MDIVKIASSIQLPIKIKHDAYIQHAIQLLRFTNKMGQVVSHVQETNKQMNSKQDVSFQLVANHIKSLLMDSVNFAQQASVTSQLLLLRRQNVYPAKKLAVTIVPKITKGVRIMLRD